MPSTIYSKTIRLTTTPQPFDMQSIKLEHLKLTFFNSRIGAGGGNCNVYLGSNSNPAYIWTIFSTSAAGQILQFEFDDVDLQDIWGYVSDALFLVDVHIIGTIKGNLGVLP